MIPHNEVHGVVYLQRNYFTPQSARAEDQIYLGLIKAGIPIVRFQNLINFLCINKIIKYP